jgi:exodeoxyribonuclease X
MINVNSKVIVLDVESTGILNHPTHGHPQVIELSSVSVDDNLSDFHAALKYLKVDEIISVAEQYRYTNRFRPSMTIDPRATEIHGLTLKDLLDKRKSESIEFPKETEYMVGHNIAYDHRCLNKPDVKLICTMELAKTLNKQLKLNLDSHKLDNLIVHFYPEDEARLVIKETHDSFTDVVKTILLLKKLLVFVPAIKTWDGLYEFQQKMKGKKKK